MTGDQIDLLDPAPLIEQAERRVTIADLAAGVEREHDRQNTLDAFAQDWARWTEFVASVNAAGLELNEHAGTDDALLVFAKWLAIGGRTARGNYVRPHAPESIRRRITGVLAGWRAAGVDYHRGVSTKARRWIKGYEDELVAENKATGRGQVPALVIDASDDNDAIRIAVATQQAVDAGTMPSLTARRDLALILIAFSVGARSAEAAFLDVSDLTPGERGLFVHVRKSKTRQRRPAVPYGSRELTCPVLAWQRWQAASGIVTGPAFRTIDRHGNLGGRISPEGCSDIARRAGQRAGIPGLTLHSGRAGFATAATRARKSPEEIAAQAGWAIGSTAMHRYIRSVKVWQDNVLDGIGL